MKHDIALVSLDRKINETDWGLDDPTSKNTICPICLPGIGFRVLILFIFSFQKGTTMRLRLWPM